MEKLIYYFIFENEFMNDIISRLSEIFGVNCDTNATILDDGFERAYILDAEHEGVSCVLANRNSYVYAVYIFTTEKHRQEIEAMLNELVKTIEDEYNDDRSAFIKPIENDSEVLEDCIKSAERLKYTQVIQQYLK